VIAREDGDAAARATWKISCSISCSSASGNLNPLWPNTLMPLSRYGLCDAEIITPAWNGPVRVSQATPGVVITPACRTRTPWLASPPATSSAIHCPDSRVSIPIRTSGPIRISGSASRVVTSRAKATPKANMVAGSSGYSPATPRIPSVPNSSFPTHSP